MKKPGIEICRIIHPILGFFADSPILATNLPGRSILARWKDTGKTRFFSAQMLPSGLLLNSDPAI